MADKTTLVEVKIKPAELFEIVQVWATEAKLSIYETNEKRTIYSKNSGFTTVWLLIEDQAESIKINTWLAPKGMGPDTKGNFFRGYKIPLPKGFAIGLAATYKKQFAKLLQMVESKSKNISYNTSTINQPKMNRESFAKIFLILGIIIFLSGTISVISAFSLSANMPGAELKKILLQKGLFDILLGVITFICSRLVKSGKVLAIWLYGAIIFLDTAYDLVMGYKFPYFIIVFGAVIIFQLMELKKSGELA